MARTGRPRSFDEEEIVERARDLFWSRGYAATSVQDLVDDLGLRRASLYGAFGDKHGLYLRAVSCYIQRNRQKLEAQLRDGSVLPALRRFLTEPAALTGVSGRHSPRGCLVGNTTAELVPGDDDAKALVAAAYDGFVEVVSEALRRGQASGEVATTATPEAQALLLQMVFQGAALVARAGIERKRLNQSIDVLIDSLRQRPAPAA
jgi:TetR/AcrR family transcriptional repressor of nem operon